MTKRNSDDNDSYNDYDDDDDDETDDGNDELKRGSAGAGNKENTALETGNVEKQRDCSWWLVECCFTSTETVGLLGTGAHDVYLDLHTALELCAATEADSMWNTPRALA